MARGGLQGDRSSENIHFKKRLLLRPRPRQRSTVEFQADLIERAFPLVKIGRKSRKRARGFVLLLVCVHATRCYDGESSSRTGSALDVWDLWERRLSARGVQPEYSLLFLCAFLLGRCSWRGDRSELSCETRKNKRNHNKRGLQYCYLR